MKDSKNNGSPTLEMVATILVLAIILFLMGPLSSVTVDTGKNAHQSTETGHIPTASVEEPSSQYATKPQAALLLDIDNQAYTMSHKNQYIPVAHEMIRSDDECGNIWTSPQGEQAVLLPTLTLYAEKGDLKDVCYSINVNGLGTKTLVFGVMTNWQRIYTKKSSDYLGYKDDREVIELSATNKPFPIGLGDVCEGARIELSIAVWASSDNLNGIEKINSTDISIDVVISADNLEKSEKARLL